MRCMTLKIWTVRIFSNMWAVTGACLQWCGIPCTSRTYQAFSEVLIRHTLSLRERVHGELEFNGGFAMRDWMLWFKPLPT